MTKEEIDNLIIQNQNLAYSILHEVRKTLTVHIDYEDLKSLALLGLVKAANTFDESKNFKFSTYAYPVIKNTILIEVRKERKYINNVSIDEQLYDNETLENRLQVDIDVIDEVEKSTSNTDLYKYINYLPIRLQKIIEYKLNGLTQQEIAKLLNISQSQVSRSYHEALNRLRRYFKI